MRQPVSNTHISAIALTLLVSTCGWSVVVSDSSESDLPPEGAPVFWGIPPAHLQNIRVGPDQETLNYLIPRLTAKFRPSDEWMGVNNDPRFYVLSEIGRQERNQINQEQENLIPTNDNANDKITVKRDSKLGRNGPSLSIVQPLDILRQRMLLEIARRKAMQQVKQVQANREILENLGKRGLVASRRQSIQARNALPFDTL